MKDYHIWLFVFGQEQNDVIFPGRLKKKKKEKKSSLCTSETAPFYSHVKKGGKNNIYILTRRAPFYSHVKKGGGKNKYIYILTRRAR